jgi:hypothetical protein
MRLAGCTESSHEEVELRAIVGAGRQGLALLWAPAKRVEIHNANLDVLGE